MKEQHEKRAAFAASLVIHAVVFLTLAAGGVFSYLQHQENTHVTDVTVYDDDALLSRSPSSVPAGGGGGGEMTVAVAPEALPQISETYTQEVEKEREIKKVAAEKGVSTEAAAKLVQQAAGPGNNAESSGGNGPGGDGNGPGGDGNGPGGDGPVQTARRPAQKARLISSPQFVVPEGARKGLHGTVALQVSIGADGSVTGVSVISNSTGRSDVEAAAIQFAYGLVYEPAINENGDNVATTKSVPVHF